MKKIDIIDSKNFHMMNIFNELIDIFINEIITFINEVVDQTLIISNATENDIDDLKNHMNIANNLKINNFNVKSKIIIFNLINIFKLNMKLISFKFITSIKRSSLNKITSFESN